MDCSEGFQYSYYAGKKAIFQIKPIRSPYPFNVFCDMRYGGRTVIQSRFKKKNLFQKSWSEYKSGFGNLASPGDFWLGNEKIHYITTSRRQKLLVQTFVGLYWRQIYHLDFTVGSESENFRMNFDSTKVTATSGRRIERRLCR
ncbi:fibrinogen-like protein 1 [Gigantopelta aegis]|uniref:fibrinogen-like protein 1 n=1 Tax=Gigantopelta aegis TaxID=1735272 RepID=UPI001B887BDC|nr:fibrinogen-like protein 1 [Gigantopelta aegis]